MESSKNNLSSRTGFWSAILLTCTLIIYTIAMIFMIFNKPSQWNNINIYAQQINENWNSWLTICHVMVFLSAPLYLIIIHCLDDYIEKEEKVFTKISISFAIILTVLGSINYFIQFSTVKLSIAKGHLDGLEQFIQLNPYSVTYAIVTLGWTFFFGLSSIFISFIFQGSRLKRVLKYAFIANGFFCFIGLFGYIIEVSILTMLYVVGMGISMIVFSIALIIYFKKENISY